MATPNPQPNGNPPQPPGSIGDPDVASIALTVATSRTAETAPLSQSEFREVYQKAMREAYIGKVHNQLRDVAIQRIHAAAAAHREQQPQRVQQQEVPRGPRAVIVGGLNGFFGVIWAIVAANAGFLMLVVVTALLVSDGYRSQFARTMGTLILLKAMLSVVLWASRRFKITLKRASIKRQVHPDNEHFSDEDTVAREVRLSSGRVTLSPEAQVEMDLRRRRFNERLSAKRRWLPLRLAVKCCTTFVISVFPKWKLENLHAELIIEGLVKDESKKREAPVRAEEPGGR